MTKITIQYRASDEAETPIPHDEEAGFHMAAARNHLRAISEGAPDSSERAVLALKHMDAQAMHSYAARTGKFDASKKARKFSKSLRMFEHGPG